MIGLVLLEMYVKLSGYFCWFDSMVALYGLGFSHKRLVCSAGMFGWYS